MESTELADELQVLQKGHGVHRPDVRRWLGPQLLALIHASPEADDAKLRQDLISLLIDAAASLPPDLRFVFLTTSGIVDDRPLLQDRKAHVGQVMQRDARTVARRMRKADALMAERLARVPDVASTYDPTGWRNQSVMYDIRLDLPRPLVRVSQVVSPVRSEQVDFQQGVSVPGSFAITSDVQVRALKGCTLKSWTRDTQRSWIAVFRVDKPLHPGQLHSLSYELEFPGLEYVAPRAALGPVRPCAEMRLLVNFGQPCVAKSAWQVPGVPPAVMNERPLNPTFIDLAHDGVVEVVYRDLIPGLVYGLAWDWDLVWESSEQA